MKVGIKRFVMLGAIAALMVVAGNTAAWAQSCPASPNYNPDFTSTAPPNPNCLVLNGTQFGTSAPGYPGFYPVVTPPTPPPGVATVLRLTPNQGFWAGSAWFNTQQPVAGGFSTTFSFQVSGPNPGPSDGIAFVIQNSPVTPTPPTPPGGGTSALALDGCGIGFADAQTDVCAPNAGGIPNSLAIELKTYTDPDLVAENPLSSSANSVSIQSNGVNPNCVDYTCSIAVNNNLPLNASGQTITLSDGNVHTVTITYTLQPSPTTSPNCFTDGSPEPCLDVTLDGNDLFSGGVIFNLTTIGLPPSGAAWVGFTAGTGGGDNNQDILSWTWQTVQGAPITPTSGLTQNLVEIPGQLALGFDYSVAAGGDPVTIQPGTTPYGSFGGITQPNWASITNGTSMADASCLLAAGQTDANGNPVCAYATLECTTTASPTPAGANCPQSTSRNVLFDQLVDVTQTQTFVGGTLTNGSLTVNQGYGIGLAMANDVLTPGAECSYPSGSPMFGQLCPQNIMTQLIDGTPHPGGTASAPNSTFLFFCCEAEWTTTATIPLWNNLSGGGVPAAFKSVPPAPSLPGNPNNFTAAQGDFVVVGAELPSLDPLDTTYPLAGDLTLNNSVPCPALGASPNFWSTQMPQTFMTSGLITTYISAINNGTATDSPLTEGSYNAHYFSVDCDAFEELTYPVALDVNPADQGTGTNQARFKIVPFNVDTTAPTQMYAPASPSGPYGSTLTVTFTCTDPVSGGVASGIAQCGSQINPSPKSYPGPANPPPFMVNVNLPTNAAGAHVFTATSADQAGNQTINQVNYAVTPVPLTITASSATVAYGAAIPAITPSYSGFVNGDTPASLTTQPTCSTTAISTSPGTYPSTCSGAVDANYTISYINGSVTVTAPPVTLKVSPSSLNFGTLYPGQTGIPQLVTVTNTGSVSAVISSVAISGTNKSDFGGLSFCVPWFTKLPGTLPPGKSCLIGVDAISVAAPPLSSTSPPPPATATLTITPSGGSAVNVPLSVVVINPVASFSASKLTFPTTVDPNTNVLSVTVTNTGTTPLVIGTPTVASSSGYFSLVSSTCTGATIVPAGGSGVKSCAITVKFAPTTTKTETVTGTLTIPDNAENSPQTITLSGTT